MSMFGVPYSPMVPSLTRWQSGERSRIAKSRFRVPTTLFDWVKTACCVDHRVGRGALLGEVDDRVGPEPVDDRFDEVIVGQVAHEQLDLALAHFTPRADPFLERRDLEERPDAELVLPRTLGEVVDDRDTMTRPRKGQRRWPAEVAVAAEHENRRAIVSLPVRGRHPFGWPSGPAGVYQDEERSPPRGGRPTQSTLGARLATH